MHDDIPVAYTRHEGALVIGTLTRPWVKNIRRDVPIHVSLGGPARTAAAEVLTDVDTVMRLYEDVHETWQQGGAVIRLTLA